METSETKKEIYYCPVCGWESFDPDMYETPCDQTDCEGKLTEIKEDN